MAKEKRVEKWPGIKTNGRQNMWSPLNLCIPPLAVSTFLICYGLPLVVPTPSLHPPASHTKGQMAKQQPSPLSSPGSVHFSPATLQLVPPLSRLSWWWWWWWFSGQENELNTEVWWSGSHRCSEGGEPLTTVFWSHSPAQTLHASTNGRMPRHRQTDCYNICCVYLIRKIQYLARCS